jgi:hypothetical protein
MGSGDYRIVGFSGGRSLDGTLENLGTAGAYYTWATTLYLDSDGQEIGRDDARISEDVVGNEVIPLMEGVIYAGRTPPSGSVEDFTFFVSRLDADGNEVWTMPYAEPNTDVRSRTLLRMGDDFLIAGSIKLPSSHATDEKYHTYVARFRQDGDMLWRRYYVGDGDSLSYRAMGALSDGGILLAVQPNVRSVPDWEPTQAQVIRLDADGSVVWQRELGGKSRPRVVIEMANGDILLVTLVEVDDLGAVSDSIQVVRADADGNAIWTRTIGGNALDHPEFVTETSDGGILIAAMSWSFTDQENGDAYIVKLNAQGQGLVLPSDL